MKGVRPTEVGVGIGDAAISGVSEQASERGEGEARKRQGGECAWTRRRPKRRERVRGGKGTAVDVAGERLKEGRARVAVATRGLGDVAVARVVTAAACGVARRRGRPLRYNAVHI